MVTRKKQYRTWLTTDMWFDDPLPEDKVRQLPRNHPLRELHKAAGDISNLDATVEVKVKEGSPLAADLDDVNVSFVIAEPPENNDEILDFIWDELGNGNTVEIKLVWPSDDELKQKVERERKSRRGNLERAVAMNSDNLFKKRKKRKR